MPPCRAETNEYSMIFVGFLNITKLINFKFPIKYLILGAVFSHKIWLLLENPRVSSPKVKLPLLSQKFQLKGVLYLSFQFKLNLFLYYSPLPQHHLTEKVDKN